MYDVVMVQCPWCLEKIELALDMTDWGEMVRDCEVCCRPWKMVVERDEYGDAVVYLDREDG
jgi:hypothetical protein